MKTSDAVPDNNESRSPSDPRRTNKDISAVHTSFQGTTEETGAQSVSEEGFVRFLEVQKTYDGENLVVMDLNLSVRRGEFLTLLGPSGSGKTTTLLMLAGFERPTSGEIRLDDKSLARVPPYHRDIGMVFQDYALFPHMNVRENVAFPLSVRKVPKSEVNERVSAALDMVRLLDFGDRGPAQLSGGQQQRVALARALVFKPQLVLMDEPLGALDKQLREQMQLEIKHIQNSLGITVIYVTHDQQEALTMSDRIAVFNEGRICQLDTPDELYEHPQNSFVAHFIGDNNRLSGTVEKTGEETCQVRLEGGSTITATPVNRGAVGEKTLLSVRPERIVLGPERGPLENSFDARIDDLIYQGDATRVRVSFPGSGKDFVVNVSNSGRHLSLTVGATVKIGWTAEDCRALDAFSLGEES